MTASDHEVDVALVDVAVANGQQPADLVLDDCHLVNVASNETYRSSIAVKAGRIVAIRTDYGGAARRRIDCGGLHAVPGLIDLTSGRPEKSALVSCALDTPTVQRAAPADLWHAIMSAASPALNIAPAHPMASCVDFGSLLGLLRNGTTPFIDLPQLEDPAQLFGSLRQQSIAPSRLRLAGIAAAGKDKLEQAIGAALSAGFSGAQVYRMVSFGPALSFGVDHLIGAIAPGRRADILLLRDPSVLVPVGSIRAGHVHGAIFAEG